MLDELLLKDPRSKVSDADCVTAMVLNILGGRTAPYRMELWICWQPTARSTKLWFLAVHSEALAAKFEASLSGKLAKEVTSVNAALNRANKKPYSG